MSRGEFGKVVSYTYTAAGEKLRMATSTDETRDYTGTMQTRGTDFLELGMPEGRIFLRDGPDFRYDYFHRDHLGNIRAVYYDSLVGGTSRLIVAQYADYDP